MRDKLLKTGKGTTDRRSPGETKTLVTSNVPKRPSAASMAGSMDGQIFEILHGVAEPLKVSLGEAIADARTAKKQDVCNHLKTLQKDGNTYCANCRVRIPQVVELK